MILWKVNKYYCNTADPTYIVAPYNLKGHLLCCIKWYGIRGLKWCYLSKKRADRKAKKLNGV